MRFKETFRGFIKPVNMKHTSYIRDFYTQRGDPPTFFLKGTDWDDFCAFMATKKTESLMVLDYDMTN